MMNKTQKASSHRLYTYTQAMLSKRELSTHSSDKWFTNDLGKRGRSRGRSFQIVVAASLHLAEAVSRVNPNIINGVEPDDLPSRYSSGRKMCASRCIRCSIVPSPSQPWQSTRKQLKGSQMNDNNANYFRLAFRNARSNCLIVICHYFS